MPVSEIMTNCFGRRLGRAPGRHKPNGRQLGRSLRSHSRPDGCLRRQPGGSGRACVHIDVAAGGLHRRCHPNGGAEKLRRCVTRTANLPRHRLISFFTRAGTACQSSPVPGRRRCRRSASPMSSQWRCGKVAPVRDADCKLAKAPFSFLFYEGGDSLSESAGARPKAVPAAWWA